MSEYPSQSTIPLPHPPQRPSRQPSTSDEQERYFLSSYTYHLPPELIAQEPAHPRDSSRLMVCDLERNLSEHRNYRELDQLIDAGETLVLNDSRVIPARVKGKKLTGGRVEVLFLNIRDTHGPIEALIKGKVREGGEILPMGGTTGKIRIKVIRHIQEGRFEVEVHGVEDMNSFLDQTGEMPVPPYIKKPLEARESYQTVYSRKTGSIAAPTAGLHFTDELLARLRRKGVRIVTTTLHVGIGTFLPVRENDIRMHSMEPEYFQLGNETRELLESGSEVIGVGTTVVKTLESVFHDSHSHSTAKLRTEGWSDLFIYPGHVFRSPLQGMLTNFHLPASTLIMLVSAYAGRDRILRLYKEAVKERYRFYSFGDAMYLKGRPIG